MPDWKVHLIFGLFLFSFLLSLNHMFSFIDISMKESLTLIFLILLVSIFPDIDMKKSKSRQLLALFISTLLALLYFNIFPSSWYFGIAYFFLCYFLIILLPTKHRGITHTIFFSLIFTISLSLLLHFLLSPSFEKTIFYFSTIFSTYLLHILLDKF
ncbi:MAG: metal-dependent hydrolase [Candidatus Aenigmatarchaeota archaeon]